MVSEWYSWEFKPRSALCSPDSQLRALSIRLSASDLFLEPNSFYLPNSNFYSLPNFTICSYILSFIKVLTIAEAPIWYKLHFSSEGTNTNNLPKFTHRSCNAKFRTQAKVLPRMTLPHTNSMKLGDYSTTSTEHGQCKLTRAPK